MTNEYKIAGHHLIVLKARRIKSKQDRLIAQAMDKEIKPGTLTKEEVMAEFDRCKKDVCYFAERYLTLKGNRPDYGFRMNVTDKFSAIAERIKKAIPPYLKDHETPLSFGLGLMDENKAFDLFINGSGIPQDKPLIGVMDDNPLNYKDFVKARLANKPRYPIYGIDWGEEPINKQFYHYTNKSDLPKTEDAEYEDVTHKRLSQ